MSNRNEARPSAAVRSLRCCWFLFFSKFGSRKEFIEGGGPRCENAGLAEEVHTTARWRRSHRPRAFERRFSSRGGAPADNRSRPAPRGQRASPASYLRPSTPPLPHESPVSVCNLGTMNQHARTLFRCPLCALRKGELVTSPVLRSTPVQALKRVQKLSCLF
ncbi:hypothetical protein MRX96_058588 [Rhipicephalus microplus]